VRGPDPTRAHRSTLAVACAVAAGLASCERSPAPPPDLPITVAGIGLHAPASVLHDPVADAYLVSNVNGDPFAKDRNGFISRLAPDGTVRELIWIDGSAGGTTLHAPNGLAIRGDTLFVADIDAVRLFSRVDGSSIDTWDVRAASYLKDITVDETGTVYVTDSGLRAGPEGPEPTGRDAVYRFDPSGVPVALVRGAALGRPSGIVTHEGRLFIVTHGTGRVIYVDPESGQISGFPAPPAGRLDGIVVTRDGQYLISSWEGRAVFGLSGGVRYDTVVADVATPADIGYDATRDRLLIPLLGSDRVEIRPLR